jgi:hypothetical protein
MSAMIVTDSHINFILSAAASQVNMSRDEWSEIGQTLVNENYRSVNYLYREDEQPHEYKFWVDKFEPDVKSIVAALKAIQAFEYQSCEHPDYLSSGAAKKLRLIKADLLRAMPGYDEAEWLIA